MTVKKLRMRKVGEIKHDLHEEDPTTEVRPYVAQRKAGKLRTVRLGSKQPNLTKWVEELMDMEDVLVGRLEPPFWHGTITLMEIADAYFSRASEMTRVIMTGEREGTILKGGAHYKFRTGELRTFMEMAKRASDFGSRMLSHEQLLTEQSRVGRESGS